MNVFCLRMSRGREGEGEMKGEEGRGEVGRGGEGERRGGEGKGRKGEGRKGTCLFLFGQRPQRGQSPVECRGYFVHPSIQP